MKGISVLISTIIVIALIVAIAAFVGPWAINLSKRQVNNTQAGVDSQITCQNTAYDFDSSYGSSGADWDFSGAADNLSAKIINTGTIKLYGLSFQVYIQGTGYKFFPIKNQITADNPLKPAQSALIEADINEDLQGQVTEVRILNGVCRTFYLAQEF